ncbi:MAG: extracellular solute-binding protein, partial [Chloroflexota bacterium]|nr:extracellular solute-binding protein [Chloroflexota bacterium]
MGREVGDAVSARRWSRREVLAAGAGTLALGLAGCADDEPDAATTEEAATHDAALTPLPTQLPPTPTQPPLTSPVAGYLDPARWQGRTLVVASPGVGGYLEALEAAFFDPFAAATGATVQHQQYGAEGVDSLREQVDNGEQVWDVVLIPTANVLPLAQAGYLAAIDYNVVDPAALYEALTMQHGVGAALYATVIVFPTGSAEVPSDWRAFWDLSRFGGTRALRRSPVGTLEFALLADGVELGQLYPLDITRAFGSLERLRAATMFWEDSKQPVELVRTLQVGLASAWTVRT